MCDGGGRTADYDEVVILGHGEVAAGVTTKSLMFLSVAQYQIGMLYLGQSCQVVQAGWCEQSRDIFDSR